MISEDKLQDVFEGVCDVLKLQIDIAAPDGGWQSMEDLVTNESL